jgi:hypothetical protein
MLPRDLRTVWKRLSDGLELVSEQAMKGIKWCTGDLELLTNCLASLHIRFRNEADGSLTFGCVDTWRKLDSVTASALLLQDVMVAGSVYCQLRIYLVYELTSRSPRHASRRQWVTFRREGQGSITAWTLSWAEWHWDRYFSQYVGFPLSVVHFHLDTTVVRMTSVWTFEHITAFSDIGEHWISKCCSAGFDLKSLRNEAL